MELNHYCAYFGNTLPRILPRGAYVICIFAHLPLAVVVALIFGCFTRMEKREKIDAPKSVEIIGYSEIEEQGREAWYRHLRQAWKPRLVLKENSITCENHATAKERLNFKKHPLKAPPLNLEPPLPLAQSHVEVEDVCDVFFVYDDDSCRDQPDEDELTQDYPEQFLKPLKKTNKPPKKRAEDGNHEAKAETQKAVAGEPPLAENEMDASIPSLSETSLPPARMKTS